VLTVLAVADLPEGAPVIAPGERVRIAWTEPGSARPHRMREEGKVIADDATALTLELDGIERTQVRVPWANVRSLAVRTGGTPAGERLAKGVRYGMAIGAVTGALVAQVTDHDCRDWCLHSHALVVEMSAGGFGILGGLVGGLAGLSGGQQWSRVFVREDKVTV